MYITEDAVLTSVWLTWACSNYETADANCPQQLIQQQKLIQQNKKDTHGMAAAGSQRNSSSLELPVHPMNYC